MTGIAKNTVAKLLVDLGGVCARYMGEHLVGLNCKRIQVDEIWAFCYSKQKNIPEEKRGQWGYGDVWTYTALDADDKADGVMDGMTQQQKHSLAAMRS